MTALARTSSNPPVNACPENRGFTRPTTYVHPVFGNRRIDQIRPRRRAARAHADLVDQAGDRPQGPDAHPPDARPGAGAQLHRAQPCRGGDRRRAAGDDGAQAALPGASPIGRSARRSTSSQRRGRRCRRGRICGSSCESSRYRPSGRDSCVCCSGPESGCPACFLRSPGTSISPGGRPLGRGRALVPARLILPAGPRACIGASVKMATIFPGRRSPAPRFWRSRGRAHCARRWREPSGRRRGGSVRSLNLARVDHSGARRPGSGDNGARRRNAPAGSSVRQRRSPGRCRPWPCPCRGVRRPAPMFERRGGRTRRVRGLFVLRRRYPVGAG